MEKRLLVAIFLSFLVLYAYQVFVLKPAADKAKREAPVAAAAKTAADSTAATAISPSPAGTPTGGPAPAASPLVAEPSERELVVETKTVRAVFTNRGARLKSWTLKKYLNLQKKPQELVPTYLGANEPKPFDLKVDDDGATARLREALFLVSGGAGEQVDVTQSAQTLVFEYKDASGLSARKAFTFEPNTYTVKVTAQVAIGDRALNPTVLWGPGLGDQVPGAEGAVTSRSRKRSSFAATRCSGSARPTSRSNRCRKAT
jgi:YidC/Oxa1 family membrane protein insertase